MKFRPYAVVGAALAGAVMSATLVAPAQAAAPADVTNVAVTAQGQVGQNWSVSASWDAAPTATGYQVAIVDHADGTVSPGVHFASTKATGVTATLKTDGLITGHTYWVSVQPRNTTEIGNPTTTSFVAMTLDTAGPTGSFTLNKTKAFLTSMDFEEEDLYTADVRITQKTLADDHTPNGLITRQVLNGDGSAAKTWSGAGTFKVVYTRGGTFTPKVLLTDRYGNVTPVTLPTVRIVKDTTAPTLRLTRPGPKLINRIAGWRTVRGTVRDTGSGVEMVMVMVVQKRGATWWAYDFGSGSWEKGTRDRDKTMEESKAMPALMEPHGSHWRTPRIHGLRAGLLHIETAALDSAFNVGRGPSVNRNIH